MSKKLALPFSPAELADDQLNVETLKSYLDKFTQWSLEQFKIGADVEVLIALRSQFIDQLLMRLWLYYNIPHQVSSLFKRNRIALIAVGGYGRQELHPLSDIDLLILSDKPLPPILQEQIGELVRLLWDIKLDVGHSVRTRKECIQAAKNDITIMTNLIESRLIIGHQSLLNELRKKIFNAKIWSSPHYFHAKIKEQEERHQRYHSTSYNLEPDIKNGPGGLRDLQTIQWIALRHFGGVSLQEINEFHYLTKEELEEVKTCRHFLWRLRFALHSIITRSDNRLLFDRQLSIAQLLGYQGEHNVPVEKMMRDYYRVVHNINELNQMLIQLFAESIIAVNPKNKPYSIDEHFQVRDTLIDIKEDNLFTQQPIMIMQLFHTMLLHPNITGIYSNTIRQLRAARRKLTGLLSDDPVARAHFMAIIRHPNAIKKALLPMHRYGILAAYIPEWKSIVGMMQFDLFHIYTVDEHTIRLLLEIDNFASEQGKQKHPTSSQVYAELGRPYLLIIAALYHDIAKGRHGDHSLLGAELVESFCRLHELDEQDTDLVVWLVRYHLLMSVTAQKRDLQDPLVIKEFAQLIKTKRRLRYLLCLTVADVCATNSTLWNSWKQSLMRELYYQTERSLELGIHQIPQQRSVARSNKQRALQQLILQGYNEQTVKTFWKDYSFDYFLRYTPEQIEWHVKHLIQHDLSQSLVLINPEPFYGGTEIFIYSPDRPYLFASVSDALSKRNLNIHDALIITNKKGFALDTFIVLEPNGNIIESRRHASIAHDLEKVLQQTSYKRTKIKRFTTRLQYFKIPTQINFLSTLSDRKTYLEVIALDRPGLLACISEVFARLDISLHSAKIATIGEHIEDLFILTDKNGQQLDDQVCAKLCEELLLAIDNFE